MRAGVRGEFHGVHRRSSLETEDPHHSGESPVCSPELRATDDGARGQMDIDPSYAQTGQATLLNERHGLVVADDGCRG